MSFRFSSDEALKSKAVIMLAAKSPAASRFTTLLAVLAATQSAF
jgi:hypothetical protein